MQTKRGIAPFLSTFGHNTAGQITSVIYDNEPAGQETPDVSITYNRLGQRLLVSNGLAKSEFTYDPATLALDKETITYSVRGVPSALHRDLLRRIHRCHSFRIYDILDGLGGGLTTFALETAGLDGDFTRG